MVYLRVMNYMIVEGCSTDSIKFNLFIYSKRVMISYDNEIKYKLQESSRVLGSTGVQNRLMLPDCSNLLIKI